MQPALAIDEPPRFAFAYGDQPAGGRDHLVEPAVDQELTRRADEPEALSATNARKPVLEHPDLVERLGALAPLDVDQNPATVVAPHAPEAARERSRLGVCGPHQPLAVEADVPVLSALAGDRDPVSDGAEPLESRGDDHAAVSRREPPYGPLEEGHDPLDQAVHRVPARLDQEPVASDEAPAPALHASRRTRPSHVHRRDGVVPARPRPELIEPRLDPPIPADVQEAELRRLERSREGEPAHERLGDAKRRSDEELAFPIDVSLEQSAHEIPPSRKSSRLLLVRHLSLTRGIRAPMRGTGTARHR